MAHYSTIGTNVIPSHYTITFESEGRKFQGQASIAIAISKATKVIKLHAKELEIPQARRTGPALSSCHSRPSHP